MGTTQIIVKKLKKINRGRKIPTGQAVTNVNQWPHKKRKPAYDCVLRCSLQHPLSQVWQVTRITIKKYTTFMTPTAYHYSNYFNSSLKICNHLSLSVFHLGPNVLKLSTIVIYKLL